MSIETDILEYVGHAPEDAGFRDWLKHVNTHLEQKYFGMGIFDLPDQPYRDWYDDGLEPDQVAECVEEVV